jgi:hypothetical protein
VDRTHKGAVWEQEKVLDERNNKIRKGSVGSRRREKIGVQKSLLFLIIYLFYIFTIISFIIKVIYIVL